jgi:predicted patatin/cPLA2 family phospholipase
MDRIRAVVKQEILDLEGAAKIYDLRAEKEMQIKEDHKGEFDARHYDALISGFKACSAQAAMLKQQLNDFDQLLVRLEYLEAMMPLKSEKKGRL